MEFQQVSPSSINYLKSASDGEQGIMFFKLRLKFKINEQNIWFLHMCKTHEVTPKHIKLKTNHNSTASQKAVEVGERAWIKEELKHLYHKRDVLSSYLKVLHSELTFRRVNIEFDFLFEAVLDKIRPIVHKKYLILKSKLDKLISIKTNKSQSTFNNIVTNKFTFFDRFKNLTSSDFTSDEVNLLSKGFKFNIKPNINNKLLENLAIESELALGRSVDNIYNKHIAKDIIENTNTTRNFSKDLNTIKGIKHKSLDNDIIFTKADKGNTVIAISKTEYVNKVEDFLKSDSFTEIRSNPTNTYQDNFKKALNNSVTVLNSYDKRRLPIMNPQPPKMYGLIKLHKNNMPIRPVVSYVQAPCRNLWKNLINIILEHTKFKSKFSIKNSQDLIHKIGHLEIPNNSKLLSFDVTNLFTNIPTKEVLDLITFKLQSNRTNPIITREILGLLNVCMDQNYFQFNNKYYKQTTGLAMGNPLSPLMAEIFMDYFEDKISKHPLFSNCVYWYRYVDDILVCFKGTDRQLNKFYDYINTVDPNIKFTLEIEVNRSINFLDLTITHKTNKHEFSIFHKPTHTDTTIHASSYHPFNHKLAAYQSMIHRLINVPMNKENFNLELNRIYTIAENNGYSKSLVNNILAKKQKAYTRSLIYPKVSNNEPKKYNCITYIGNPSLKISKVIKKAKNINIAYRTNNTIAKYIKNNKDKTDKTLNSGVYKLTCECNKVYIGQTGRTFVTRISEHKKSYEKNKEDSTFANHCLEENHMFNDNFNVLHIQTKGRKLDLLEAMEINRYNKLNLTLNDQKDIIRSPLLSLNL